MIIDPVAQGHRDAIALRDNEIQPLPLCPQIVADRRTGCPRLHVTLFENKPSLFGDLVY